MDNFCPYFVLLELNLNALLILSPFVIATLLGAYYFLLKSKRQFVDLPSAFLQRVWHGDQTIYRFSLLALMVLPVALYVSWMLFWVVSVLILILSLFRTSEEEVLVNSNFAKIKISHYVLISLLAFAAVGLTYAVSISNLVMQVM